MPEQIRSVDQLVWEYAITLPPSPGDGKQILISVKRYAPSEQVALVYTKSADGGLNKILEIGADGTPGFAPWEHPREPTTLIVRIRYRETRDRETHPWRESALKLVYSGPEELVSHGNPQFRQNRIVLGAELRPLQRIAAGEPLRWSDLRMNLCYNGQPAQVRPSAPLPAIAR
jgi:hypothetical protein